MARWRVRFVYCVATALCAACASTPAQPAVRRAPSVAARTLPEVREAARLLRALPTGADACVVAFPGRLSERRRRLVARLSQTSGLPYLAPEGPRVYVEASRGRPDGGVSRVILLSFAGDADTVARFLTTGAPLVTRFAGGDAGGPHFRARTEAPGLVRLERGAWPADAPVGVERGCARRLGSRLAARAFEFALGRTHSSARAREPLAWSWLLPASAAVLERQSQPPRGDGPGLAVPQAGSSAELDALFGVPRLRGDGVGYERRIRFEDLELLARDDAQRRSLARLARDDRALPVADVRVADVDELLRQVGRREALYRLARARGDAEDGRVALLALLRRGLVAHPDDPRVVLPLARLALELGEDPEAVLAELSVLEAAATADPRALGPLRREAHAHQSTAHLARGLAHDLGLSARESSVAARQLRDGVGQGTPYEVAEGLWLAQRALSQARRTRRRAPPGSSWPVSALPEAAAALVDEGGLARSLYVVARAPALAGDDGNLPLELSGFATLHYDDGTEGVWVVGATTRGTDVLLRLGALLASRVGAGALELWVASVPFGGDAARPDAFFGVEGEVRVGRLTSIRLAFHGASRIDWARVSPLLVEPLAAAGVRIFPTPDFEFEGLDSETAREVSAALDSVATCRWRVGGLTCAPRADRATLARALADLCRRDVTGAAL